MVDKLGVILGRVPLRIFDVEPRAVVDQPFRAGNLKVQNRIVERRSSGHGVFTVDLHAVCQDAPIRGFGSRMHVIAL